MSKIIKLDKNLANQIAAWEVIERPISIVKELVENSIDAWSDSIKIEIFNWGIDKIIITDNWEWIEKQDLPLTIEKYSTSKIKNLEDLYNIMTFGFRWEALASISSVSKLEIITKTKLDNFWSILQIEGWESLKISDYASEIWTKIIVKDLFFNTPARLNYLKTAKTEYNHIYEFLNQISLSYPNIWFEFISDWKNIFKFNKNETLDFRIYKIFWEELSKNILELDFELTWIKITWYISDPKISFSNKNRQSIFVNKRIIKSPLIYKAVSDAYNRYIPHSSFSAYILNLQIDPTQVDVNVHPKKLEVRFANESLIFKWFYSAIQDKLEKVSLIAPNLSTIPTSENINISSNLREENKNYYTWSWTKFKSYSPYSNKNVYNPSQNKIWQSIDFTKELLNSKPDFDTISSDLHDTKLWKIVWQVHNSYIIVETPNWIKFLDQHALAERIIYEKLVHNKTSIQTQWLLIWESFNLTPKEKNILEENKTIFEEMWFDFEILSWNIIIINWIPDFIKKENLSKIFSWILDDIWEVSFSSSKTLQEVKNKIFAYTACRSAIKFWNKLNLFEMNKLLNDSVSDYSSTCPHWRPVVFDISLEDLKGKYER